MCDSLSRHNWLVRTPFIILACLVQAGAEAIARACSQEDHIDEPALSLLQTSLELSRLQQEKVISGSVGESCAVCFIGQFRNLKETRESLWSKLLEPLAAKGAVAVDIFVAGSTGGPSKASDLLLATARDGITLRSVRWEPEPSDDVLQDKITKFAPKEAVEHYMSTPGQWLGPAFGQPGNAVRIYNHEADCAEMVQDWEHAHGTRYTYIVRTRPDFLWLAPHPPLSLLSSDKAWTFDTESWHGMNPRHVVGGRDFMINGLLNKLRLLQSGDPVVYRMNCSRGCSRDPSGGYYLADERFNLYVAEKFSVPIGIFPTLAYLVQCPEWSNCWRSYVAQRNPAQGKTYGSDGLYDKEKEAAERNAARLEDADSHWMLAEKDDLHYRASLRIQSRHG